MVYLCEQVKCSHDDIVARKCRSKVVTASADQESRSRPPGGGARGWGSRLQWARA